MKRAIIIFTFHGENGKGDRRRRKSIIQLTSKGNKEASTSDVSINNEELKARLLPQGDCYVYGMLKGSDIIL